MAIVFSADCGDYQECVENYYHYFPSDYTLEEKIKRVEDFRSCLHCKNSNKWRYFGILIGAISHDEQLAALYEINEDAHYWSDRVKRRSNKVEPPRVVLRPAGKYSSLPVCYDYSHQEFSGLYFMGATYFDPVTMVPIYAVKVGKSDSDIGQRIRSYGTANPFIYHERTHVLPYAACWEADEETCHRFLASVSVQNLEKDTEWYIVDRETYFFLCENFKRVTFFEGVATGKIRAI